MHSKFKSFIRHTSFILLISIVSITFLDNPSYIYLNISASMLRNLTFLEVFFSSESAVVLRDIEYIIDEYFG